MSFPLARGQTTPFPFPRAHSSLAVFWNSPGVADTDCRVSQAFQGSPEEKAGREGIISWGSGNETRNLGLGLRAAKWLLNNLHRGV